LKTDTTVFIMLTTSSKNLEHWDNAYLRHPWSESPPKVNHLFIGLLTTFLKISCKSIQKFLHKVANIQTNRQWQLHILLDGGKYIIGKFVLLH